MIELLELCGFESQEITSELPRIERAFQRLGITDQDIEKAKKNLTKYHNTELKSVRKLLGLYFRHLVDLSLAREEGKTKIIYAIMAEGFDVISSAFSSKSEEIFVSWPETIFEVVFGPRFFDKMVPILEVAENKWLKAGVVAHCSNIKMLVGSLELDLIPKPDFLIVSGFLCDSAPKTIDLMHELYDIPMAYYGTCLDREIKEVSEKKRFTLAAHHMRKLAEHVQDVVGFEISDNLLWEQINARAPLKKNISQVHELFDNSDRLPISASHESIMFAFLPRLAANITNLTNCIETTNILYEELYEMVSKGAGVVELDAPRILALVPGNPSDPRLERLIEETGISLVSSEMELWWPDGYRHAKVEKTEDPYETASAFLLDSKTRNLSDRIHILVEACKRLKVDGVLCRSHVGCRTISGDTLIIKDALTKELGLPSLVLEYDGFDPRVFNYSELKRKLELFKVVLDSSRESKKQTQ